jgi:ATP-binding cassette subfamily B protein
MEEQSANSLVPIRILTGLLQYVLRFKARVFLAFLLALVGVGVELLRPWPVQVAVDYVLLERSHPGWLVTLTDVLPLADTQLGLLSWVVAVAIGIAIANAAFSWLVLAVTVTLGQRLVYTLSIDLFAKLQRLSIAYHGRHPLGDLLQRINQDVFVVYLVVANVALPLAISALTLSGMFLILARMDFTLAMLTMGVVPFLAASLVVFMKPMDTTTTRQYAAQGAVMALVEQSLSAIKVVQGFARESFMQGKMEQRALAMANAYGTAVRVSGAYNQISTAITGTGAALLVGFGGKRVLDGHLTVGELLVFLGYVAALYGPVNHLTTAIGVAVQVVSQGRRVFAVLEAEEEVRDRRGALHFGRSHGRVAFENVTFGYDSEGSNKPRHPIIQNISFEAAPGQITAIVGATGAGKTSLVGLLSRFYDPWEGRVLIDGHDLRDLTLSSLRENVSLVLQESFLFPISAADNIAFGRPQASRDEIIEAARIAHAHEFIRRLPDGYDTMLGEKGTSLSGGERQRIAIARAVLKDAPVLVLDEPTSALDARTEAQIFEALSHLMHDRTTFIISHRLSTIRRADQILALAEGRIVERGTHESLLTKGGVYARLYRHQHLAAV